MNLPVLPSCRHRGPEFSPGFWTCSSTKLVTPAGIVEADVCLHECPYIDHEPDDTITDVGDNELLGHLTIQPKAFESVPVHVRSKPEMLSVGMITAPRPVRTLERSLTELRRAGFLQTVHIFAEPDSDVQPADGLRIETHAERRGLWGNWLYAAQNLLQRTDNPFILICEDDIQLTDCAALGLQHAMETCDENDWGYVSLYTPFQNVRNRTITLGWQPIDLGEQSWGALAYCFSRNSLKALLNSPTVKGHTGSRDTDAIVSLAFQQLGRKCWYHVPSLCDHAGTGISSMGHEGRQEFAAIGFKPDYSQYRDPLKLKQTGSETDFNPSRISLIDHQESSDAIPKIIHQVWIGEHPPPEECLQSWKNLHPDWEYKLWNESNIEFPLQNQTLFEATPNFSGKVNLLRYEILKKYGGFYVDADMLCLKPIPEEITSNRFVSVYEDEFGSPGLINNCFLGAPAGSPIIRALIDELHTKSAEEVSRIPSWKITGPVAVTEILQPVLGEPDVKIFPSRYFVPIHFSRERPTAGPLFDAFAVHLFGSTMNAAADLEYFRQSFLKGNARPVTKQKRKRLQDLTVIVQSSFVPSHPSTEMIERSLASLSRLGDGFRVLTVFDGFQGSEEDCENYRQYKQRARASLPGDFCELSDWKHSGGTLGPALQMVQTPFLLYWEHDWELITAIPTEDILTAIDELDDVRFIRLNKRRNVTQDSDRELQYRPGTSPVPLVMTPRAPIHTFPQQPDKENVGISVSDRFLAVLLRLIGSTC